MKDSSKTKQELIEELSALKKKIKKLEKSESKLKLAEDGVLESEENYRRLFSTMAQGVVYQSSDGQIISANPAAERILGLSLDQMQGKTSLDPGWKAIREDGSELSGQEHPSMVALRTGKLRLVVNSGHQIFQAASLSAQNHRKRDGRKKSESDLPS